MINSTRIINNSFGAIVYSALFDPYGGMQKQWVNTYNPSLKFSGKERETGSETEEQSRLSRQTPSGPDRRGPDQNHSWS